MNTSDLWKATLGALETELSPTVYKSFFAVTKLGNCNGENVEIVCPSKYVLDHVNNKYLGLIKERMNGIEKGDYKITFRIEKAEIKEAPMEGLPLFDAGKNQESDSPSVEGLSPKYTFESFIVGPSNRLAHAIAAAIAENPGKVYNPFFLHAGVGLGKTHLIHAIGNQAVKFNPKLKVVYATAESFMNELIEAIQEGRNKNYSANKFRNKFRKADILLIDDIQFIAGRGEATQEEFFHTFNALYMAQKQIVLTSDRPPRELSKLDVRITSRFSSGVVADIQKPNAETRSAILREKRDRMKVEISNEVVDFIALNIETNIRELEGMFLQVITQARADGVGIDKDFAAKVLGKTIKKGLEINVNNVLRGVCNYYNIKMTDLKGKSRVKQYVVPRQVSMYLLKEYASIPYMSIGDLLGSRDHTTIMHGFEKIEGELESDVKLKQDVSNLKKILSINV